MSAPAAASSLAGPLVARLVYASLAGAVAVAVVYAALRIARHLPPALRCTLWWLACLKLVLALVWVRPFLLPLPAAVTARLPGAPAAVDLAGRGSRAAAVRPGSAGSPVGGWNAAPSAPALWRSAGPLALLALWGGGLAAGIARTGRELAAARRIRRGARPAGPPLAARCAELAERVGLSQPPVLLMSDRVASPLSLGLLAPAVVLPADLSRLGGERLDMALCHELIHVRRADLWLAWIPAAAARLFFFHPLAHLAAREYALAREAACDAEVLARLAPPPAVYARLLLDFGTGRLSGAVALSAVTSPATLKRRLLMLDTVTRRPRAPWLWLAGLGALAALAPLRIAAQAAPAKASERQSARAAAASPADAKVEAQRSAEAWLALVDRGQYAQSWEQAAAVFRSAATKDAWRAAVQAAREPLGRVRSRRLRSADYTTRLPGAPDGRYVVIQYDTAFDKKAAAVETITPTLDQDGTWRVAGYFVR